MFGAHRACDITEKTEPHFAQLFVEGKIGESSLLSVPRKSKDFLCDLKNTVVLEECRRVKKWP